MVENTLALCRFVFTLAKHVIVPKWLKINSYFPFQSIATDFYSYYKYGLSDYKYCRIPYLLSTRLLSAPPCPSLRDRRQKEPSTTQPHTPQRSVSSPTHRDSDISNLREHGMNCLSSHNPICRWWIEAVSNHSFWLLHR